MPGQSTELRTEHRVLPEMRAQIFSLTHGSAQRHAFLSLMLDLAQAGDQYVQIPVGRHPISLAGSPVSLYVFLRLLDRVLAHSEARYHELSLL